MSSATRTSLTGSSAVVASMAPTLTTTFVPTATTCTENQLTMLANRQYQIWMNEPVPAPGMTFSDCYPSQYMTSYLLSAGSVTQPAFNPLVCPINYSAVGPYTSNYIACCPSGYSLAPPSTIIFSDRPAFGGTCYTPLTIGTPVRITAYGSYGITATTTWMASATNDQAYAHPIDGFALGVKEVPSMTSSGPDPTGGTMPMNRKGITTGVMVGGVIGSTFGVALLLVLAFLLFRYRRQNMPSPDSNSIGSQSMSKFSSSSDSDMERGRQYKRHFPSGSEELYGCSAAKELGQREPAELHAQDAPDSELESPIERDKLEAVKKSSSEEDMVR